MVFDHLRHRVKHRIDDYRRSRQAAVEWRHGVARRIADYRRSKQADIVLSDEALHEAAELWQAAQPANAEQATPEEIQRLDAARYDVGWLHKLRFDVLPERSPEKHAELARAIVHLAPLGANHGPVPYGLQATLGADANADFQALLALDLLAQAEATTAADLALLDAAIWLLTASLASTTQDHNRAMNLFIAYRRRFERDGVMADLDQAIEVGEHVVAVTPRNHPDRAERLSYFASAYWARFERSGVLADLDQAIDASEQAVAAIPENHPDRVGWLSNLSLAYGTRFERGGVLADLDQAIEAAEQAVAATPDNDPDRGRRLSGLDVAYAARFDRRGVLADLDKAVKAAEQAVAATPENHPDRAGHLLNLGAAYQRRFDRGGALTDLDQAIAAAEQAVAATPQDHPNRADCFSNLGVALRTRFDRVGVVTDLDKAIAAAEQAVAATPNDHPDQASFLSNLSVAYLRRFSRVRALTDLDRTVEAAEQAVAATPDNDPDRAARLSNLGSAYNQRFQHGKVLIDLDLAIERSEQAVAATPNDHPDRAMYLSNLGLAYRARFGHGGEVLSDLKKATECSEQAVAATPNDHSDRAMYLSNLGLAYGARLYVNKQGVDREAVRALADQVTAAPTASPKARVNAGHIVGSLAHSVGEHGLAVELLDAAVRVLPSVMPREAGWADQEHRLGKHLGLVGETVAAHCAINDPIGAVEASELGRGILLATQLDSRTDLTELEQTHADLAAEFRGVRDQLNTPRAADTAPAQPGIDPVERIEHRRRLWSEHDQLLARIRQRPGFARFLLPPSLADLQPATAGGAAILVNTAPQRSDAIIITGTTAPVHVPLPDATLADVESQALALLEATHGDSPAANLRRQRVVPEILSWLWDSIVEPALLALPPTGHGTSGLPRVWWLPTGLLGLFPLHAAGHPNKPGALDAVISSYTPTLRSLAHSRTRLPATARRQLTVALHHTPGQPDLPGTVAEATTLHASHADNHLLLDEDATTDRVLAALPEATWVHFACHASVNLTTSSHDGLALHDTTLALPNISQLRLNNAELAYLSACSTGLRMTDESLNLASAFQLAGFRHVIASLWPLNDHIATETASAFYQHMPTTPTTEHAATALHHVTRQLRTAHPNRPDLWAALIHSGP